MRLLSRLALILVIVGAVNWGFVGLLGVDFVFAVFGNSIVTKVLYIIVGISGIYIFLEKLLGKIIG